MPYFAIALQSNRLLPILDRQNFREFKVVDIEDRIGQKQDLLVFHSTPATYYFVSVCDEAMQKVLEQQ